MLQVDVRIKAVCRLSLFLGFFLTCVLFPLFKVTPFFSRVESYFESDYSTIISYFFDSSHSISDFDHEWDSTTYYLDHHAIFNYHFRLLAVSGWIMILLGLFVACAAVWVFYQECISLESYHFSPLRWFSILSVVSFLIEWLLILIIVNQEPWIVPTVNGPHFHSPVLNLFLCVIMLFGQICLFLANNLDKFIK